MKVIPFLVLLILTLSALGVQAQSEKIKMVSTLEIFSSIAKRIGGVYVESRYIVPPGTDIHDYSLTPEDVGKIRAADVIILANSEFFSLDKKIMENAENKRILDFPDYNATVIPLGTMERCFHGYWFYSKNAEGIAHAVYRELSALDPEHGAYYHSNYVEFLHSVNSTIKNAKNLMNITGMSGQGALLAVPGAAYVVKEMGMKIHGVLVEGPNQFASREDVEEYKKEIQSGEIRVIVNVKNMENSRAGLMAQELSRETGVKVVYVNIFFGDNYTSLLMEDAAVLSSASSVEVYGNGVCDYSTYYYVFAVLVLVVAVLGYLAYSYRREIMR